MQTVETFDHDVRDIENEWIPLSDGCRLAARIWRPVDAEDHPVPAILEYIPYRKRDFMRGRDEAMHRYFAGHGYAAVRVDMRGSGESDGLLHDEYLKQEQDDALEVIAWIAAQPWCDGAVGMMGKSWGGFNALQVAARRPPALKAILPVMGTDDRFAEDVHYSGGCLLNDNFWWGAIMHIFNARPPDPAIVGEGWRAAWLERLDADTFWPIIWLGHQTRDAYWRHGSVCEDYAAIQCPVYFIGGWADLYRDTPFRLAAGLEAPWKVLVGPWAHLYPQDGLPQPAIGFLQEALRWWDQWLKGIDTGVMDEPALRVWMQESVPPRPYYGERPGRWVAEESWPSPRIETRRFALNRHSLDAEAGPEEALVLPPRQDPGAAAGDWVSFAIPGDMPLDQRVDDGGALTFDSAPLEQGLEILGGPELVLDLAVDRACALVAVRLSDMAPDGASTAFARGVLNLTHRDGHEEPAPLEPGRRYRVTVRLHGTAYAVAPGHRLRLSLSSGYWPIVWPSPEPVTLTVYAGAGELRLPERPPRAEDAGLAAFAPPEQATPMKTTTLRKGRIERTVVRDAAGGETCHRLFIDGGVFGDWGKFRIDDIGLEMGHVFTRELAIREDDPLSARATMVQSYETGRGDWRVRIEARARMTSSAAAFHLTADLDAYEGETRVFSRTWTAEVPRNGV